MSEEFTKNEDKRVMIEDVMSGAYMEYAMSVIVSRALPDVRDGLKPVHRRILHAMNNGGYTSDKPYRKSARIVGDVMGKYHPHGDSAIYDSMVRMAQSFSIREPLVDGQGNFGSLDGDPPAAMRYTEARMAKSAHDMVRDIEKGTVNWKPTYDSQSEEPVVLPTRIPNLLINGSAGIAVGMATNMPTHNAAEAITACLLVLDNPEATLDDVMEVMPGPDFPTGGVIMGRGNIRQAYETGRGSLVVSGVADIEELSGNRSRIVISELPYNVNKTALLDRLAELATSKEIDGVSDIRDESDREEGVRVVIDLKKDVDPALALNKIRKNTRFVSTFSVNSVCLDARGRPSVMPLMDQIHAFVEFRKEVVRRRTIFDLDKARDQIHRQLGLYAAVTKIDEVVQKIRSSSDVDDARVALMGMEFETAGEFGKLLLDADPDIDDLPKVFHLSEIQTNAILQLSLRYLTGLERDRIAEKARQLSSEIEVLTGILNDHETLLSVVRTELQEVAAKHTSERLTRIELNELDILSDEDLIERADIVVTMTRGGYVKRTGLDAYREQKRGGKGKSGFNIKDGDHVSSVLACSTHSPLLFFTSRGIAHSMKAWQLPEGQANSRGRPLINYMPLQHNDGEEVTSIVAMPEGLEDTSSYSMVFVTDFGNVRRTNAAAFNRINKAGKIAMDLKDDDGNSIGRLIDVILCNDDDTIMLTTYAGRATRFRVGDLREIQSRNSIGVRGVRLAEGDRVVSATKLASNDEDHGTRQAYLHGGTYKGLDFDNKPFEVTIDQDKMDQMREAEEVLLTISEKGFGKRTSAYDFRLAKRGGRGITVAKLTETSGGMLTCLKAGENDGLLIITEAGQTIRLRVADISIQGRITRGVRLFNISEDDRIVYATLISGDEVEEGNEPEPEELEEA